MTYYGKDLTGANLPFNFQLLQCAWSAEPIAQVLSDYDAALPAGAWPNWVLGNHDQPRVASRIGAHQARVAAMLLLTLPGTLTMYYGEEIGMTDVPIAPEDVQDPAGEKRTRHRRGPRPGAHPHAVGLHPARRIHYRPSLAAHRTGPRRRQCRRAGRRSRVHPHSLPRSSSVCAPPTPRSSTAKCNPSQRTTTSSAISASAQTKRC